VRVEAAGLCHTDIHAAHGDWPVKPKLPLIPGHEGVGIVTALGPGITGVAEGDRLWAMCPTGWTPSRQRR
jgi:alcohol dehydrogenase, propanol-preferring